MSLLLKLEKLAYNPLLLDTTELFEHKGQSKISFIRKKLIDELSISQTKLDKNNYHLFACETMVVLGN